MYEGGRPGRHEMMDMMMDRKADKATGGVNCQPSNPTPQPQADLNLILSHAPLRASLAPTSNIMLAPNPPLTASCMPQPLPMFLLCPCFCLRRPPPARPPPHLAASLSAAALRAALISRLSRSTCLRSFSRRASHTACEGGREGQVEPPMPPARGGERARVRLRITQLP